MGSRATDNSGTALADVLWMRDVTEGATAVESLSHERHDLAAERDRLRALLDALPLPVWLRDGDLALIYCNQAYARAVDAEAPESGGRGRNRIGAGAGACAKPAPWRPAPGRPACHAANLSIW